MSLVLCWLLLGAPGAWAANFVYGVNSGGGGAGPFLADTFFSGGSSFTSTNSINTSGAVSPAPQTVYQTERYGNFSYTFPSLTPNGRHLVRLHFAETFHTSSGARVFNVSINGTAALSNYDIYADAGGINRAVVKEFNVLANASGQIVIQFTSVVNNAKVSGIEIFAAEHAVNSGGAAVGLFSADGFFTGGSVSTRNNPIDLTRVTHPAPAAVYQAERYGNFSYTFPGLTPGGSYAVKLHFAEVYYSTAGARVFNVAINGTAVLTNYDIFAATGGMNRTVAREFYAVANSSGQIVVQFTGVVDNAKVSGIEIYAASGAASLFCLNADIDRGSSYSGVGAAPDSGTRWNALGVTSNPATPVTWNNLLDSQSRATSCTIGISSSSGAIASTTNTTSTNGNPNPSTMMRDFLTTNTYTVTVSGLAQGSYFLYAYAHGSSAANNSTITVNAANGGGSKTTGTASAYRNIFATGAENNSYVKFPVSVDASGTLTFTAAPFLNGFQVVGFPRPTITANPAAATSAPENSNVVLSVTASGEGTLSYQWRKAGVNLSNGVTANGSSISGATASVLVIADVRMADAGEYDVVVTSSGGSVTSTKATLTVTPAGQTIWMAQPDGYAADVTGGAGGAEVTVTTAAQLLQYATSTEPYVIKVSGTIVVTGGTSADGKRVDVKSNKTIEGVGMNATINGLLNISGVQNVIVRRLTITHPGSVQNPSDPSEYSDGGDGISIWNSKRVFVTQCTFVDCGDGMCDITQNSDFVTVSWCKFTYTSSALLHRLTMIVGNSDPTPSSTDPGYRTSIHHNWWATNCNQRMPTGSFSAVHVYNNYFNAAGNAYCTLPRTDSQWLVQNNHYQQVNNPAYKQEGGKMQLSGNTFQNCTGYAPGYDATLGQVTPSDTVVLPTYQYWLHNAGEVPAIVMAGAGASGNLTPQGIFFGALPQKTQGGAPFTLNGTASSGLPVSYVSSNPAVATVAGDTVTIVGPGSTVITAGQPGNAVHAPAQAVQQVLVVTPQGTLTPQTITFEPLPQKTNSSPAFALTATADSGLPVSYTSSDPSVAIVSGSTVTIVGVGTATITASQSGNATYEPAEDVQQFLVVIDAEVAWAQSYGLDPQTNGAPGANPDGDDLVNALEFFLGRNPNSSDSGETITVKSEGGALVAEFYRAKAAVHKTFALEYNFQLDGPWSTAHDGVGGVTIETIPVNGNLDLIRVTVPSTEPKGFCRLKL